MATFLMFGKYSPDATKEISAQRTEKGARLIEKFNGKLISAYALSTGK